MEGYLYKRSSGTFGAAWKQRWFILERDGVLKLYDTFDLEADRVGKHQKESRTIDSSWLVRRVDTDDQRENTFILTHDDHPSWYLSAPTAWEMDLWLKEFSGTIQAANPDAFDYNIKGGTGYYQTLGMSTELSYGHDFSRAMLAEFFQRAKAAIFAKGDKSDATTVEKLHSLRLAYYAVQTKHFPHETDDPNYAFRHHKYDVTLKKSAQGEVGITLARNPVTSWLSVSAIDEKVLQASDLSPLAKGRVRIHDAIYSVGSDIVQTWTLSRVLQRFSALRLSPESSIKVVLCRPYYEDNEDEHVNENLSEDYIISAAVADVVVAEPAAAPASTQKNAKANKVRGSIFSWGGGGGAAASASSEANLAAMTEGGEEGGDKAEKAEAESEEATPSATDMRDDGMPTSASGKRGSGRSILQRARASLSWANSASLAADVATEAAGGGGGAGSGDSGSAKGTSTSVPLAMSEDSSLLESVSALKAQLKAAAAAARTHAQTLTKTQAELKESKQKEKHLEEEVRTLKKSLLAFETPASERSSAFTSMAMHEKIVRLRERYPAAEPASE